MNSTIEDVPLALIRQTYSAFRIVHPSAEKAMERSLSIYGQLSPLVCAPIPDGLELIDGFKRLRAAETLQWSGVKIRRLETTIRSCKAGIIQLNRVSRSISDLEEAMILRSLHRDDGMSQTELATLLGRDKSWVCRRISLVERLNDEIWHHIGIGLIPVSVGRELAKLPRGNQSGALQAVVKYRFGKRETEALVRRLLTEPRWNCEAILRHARELEEEDHAVSPVTLQAFSRLLTDLERGHRSAIAWTKRKIYPENDRQEAQVRLLIESSRTLADELEGLLIDPPEEVF